ncbi:lyase family protein, partial [Parvimonas sp. D9]|uniref:lyase family protein n=1 Tax=Parvimonas sp. D9 TaxID=3110689 RepID=UPI002B4A65F7
MNGVILVKLIIHHSQFTIHESVEDIHSQVEFLLTQKLGDIGKKIHSARSRNDQVLVDIKMFLRHEIQSL